ncbi:MAG: glycosyltransferase family 2 protein [Paracoccus sp. (in: a-proteobacteria)]
MDFPFLDLSPFLHDDGYRGIVALTLVMVLFEMPRYGFITFALIWYREPRPPPGYRPPPYSVALVGHNEGETIVHCIVSLEEQSCPPAEIIVVSDGSTDDMPSKLLALQAAGRISVFHRLDLRGGRSSASNLAFASASHDLVVSVDTDTTFDRHAMRNALYRLEDPQVGAVSGNVMARNAGKSLLADIQNMEYRITIGAGRSGLDMINQVSLVSGAFAAFRASALRRVSGMDPVSGEDLDITLRLRRAGYRIAFARNAICRTEVPTTMRALINQRFRWERDALALRMRRHSAAFNPRSPQFTVRNLIGSLDFLLFDLAAAIVLPFFILSMGFFFGVELFSLIVLFAVAYTVLHGFIFMCDGFTESGLDDSDRPAVLPAYTVYSMFFVRLLRFLAYSSEIFFRASEQDDFVPQKIRIANGGTSKPGVQ